MTTALQIKSYRGKDIFLLRQDCHSGPVEIEHEAYDTVCSCDIGGNHSQKCAVSCSAGKFWTARYRWNLCRRKSNIMIFRSADTCILIPWVCPCNPFLVNCLNFYPVHVWLFELKLLTKIHAYVSLKCIIWASKGSWKKKSSWHCGIF